MPAGVAAVHVALPGVLNALPDWWEKIDHDPEWQYYSFLALAIAYGLVGAVALVQLLRIQLRVPEYGWTTQKVFHLLNFLVCSLRCGVFAFRGQLQTMQPALQAVLLDLPGLLFFSTYTLLVLFWAEIYHQARSLPTASLRPVFVLANALAYAVQVCLWIFLGLSEGHTFRLAKVSARGGRGGVLGGGRGVVLGGTWLGGAVRITVQQDGPGSPRWRGAAVAHVARVVLAVSHSTGGGKLKAGRDSRVYRWGGGGESTRTRIKPSFENWKLTLLYLGLGLPENLAC